MAGNFKFRFIWYLIYHYKIIGRVVNLFESENPEEKVFGVAYEIDQETWNSQVMAHLDDREKGGYSQHVIIQFEFSRLNYLFHEKIFIFNIGNSFLSQRTNRRSGAKR